MGKEVSGEAALAELQQLVHTVFQTEEVAVIKEVFCGRVALLDEFFGSFQKEPLLGRGEFLQEFLFQAS